MPDRTHETPDYVRLAIEAGQLVPWAAQAFDGVYVTPKTPCFCVYDARTGGRTPNPHCPRHRPGGGS